jgi:TP901 family phage tail tape measure protein
MAFSARELVLILRATNQASGPIRQVSRDLRSLGSGTAAAGRGADQLARNKSWARMGAASAILRDTGRSARLMGIAVGAGLGFAATGAAQFQKQAGLVATQTGSMNLSLGRTTAEMQKNATVIQRGVLAQMNKFPASAQEMNDALYEIYSSTNLGSQGLTGVRKGLKLLTTMNKASVAGQADLSDITAATTTVMNAFGTSVDKIPATLQRMFAAVRFGRMTFPDFVKTFSQIVPATQAAGQSFDTMVGTMAALTRTMPNVRMAATAYSRLLEIVGRKAFVTGAKKWGMTITDTMGRLKPLNEIVGEFNKLMLRTPEKDRANILRNFFKEISSKGEGTKSGFEGTIQARRALINLMKNYGLYSKVLHQTTNDNNEFTKSFRVMADTAGVKWETFVNSMRATFIKLGAAAIPVLLQLLAPIQRLAEWFIKLDDATRRQIVNWLAMGAAITILGGTFASLAGTIGMILAALKISPVLFLSGLTAIAAALLLIHGNGNLVKTALDNLFSAATSSAQNFGIFLAATTVAVLRLRGAIVSTAAAASATSLVSAIGGIGAGIGRGKEAFGVKRTEGFNRSAGKYIQRDLSMATRSANGLKAAFAGSAVAAASVAGGLLPVIGIVAAIAGGAYLWSRHQKKIADEAARLEASQRIFRQFARAPVRAAESFGTFGIDARQAKRAELSVKSLDIQLKNLRASLKTADAADRPAIRNQISTMILDRADALDVLNARTVAANKSWSQMTATIQGTLNNFGRMNQQEAQLAQMQERRRELIATTSKGDLWGLRQIDILNSRIGGLKASLAGLRTTTVQAATVMRGSFTKAVQDLMRGGMLPKAPKNVIDDMLVAFTTARKRAPTLKEARLFIKAALDPSSLNKVDKDIRAFVGRTERLNQIKLGRQFAIDTKQIKPPTREIQKGLMPGTAKALQLPVGLQPPKDNGKSVRARIAATFKVASKHSVQVVPPPTGVLHQIGASITQGVEAGISPVHVSVIRDFMQGTVKGMEKEGRGGSPMMLFADKVGLPIIQGIIVGIMKNSGKAADAAVFAIDQIEGKTVAKMTQFLKKQASLFQGMNANLNTLVRRKVPLQLVEQLAQAGEDGAKQVAKLASASKTELAKFVAAWRQAQAQVGNSAKFNWTQLVQFVNDGAAKLLELYNQARDNLRDFAFGSLADFTAKARETADTIANAFGQIFQGPMNISEHIGQAFDDAQASYASSMAGFQEQMEELQQRQADTISDFMERRRDELRSAFGKLFSGPILSAGFAAGSVRDLIADLNRQMADFQNWRKNLDILAGRGVPQALLKSLEELGPEASQNMSLLVNATDEELAEWIAAWKNGEAEIEKVTQATYMNMDGFAEAMAEIAEQMAKVAQQMSSLQAPKRANFAMLLADLQGQMQAWRDYNGILTSLQAKGVPALLISELAALGVEGVDILRILNTGTEAELATYIATWVTKQGELKAARKTWQETLAPEEILSTMGENADALREFDTILQSLATRGVSPAILQQLRELGPSALPLLRGLNAMTEEQLITGDKSFVKLWKETHGLIDTAAKEFVDGQVALWREQGSKIAAGLIAGVMDEQAQLLAFFRNLFKSLLNEAKKETKTSSPSQVYYELGRNIVTGFQQGLSSMTPSLAMPGTGSITGAFAHRTGNGINMTVNAYHSESLQSTLERTSFRMRQRRVN